LGKAEAEVAFAAFAEGAAGSEGYAVFMDQAEGEAEAVGEAVDTDEGVEGAGGRGEADAREVCHGLGGEHAAFGAVGAEACDERFVGEGGEGGGLDEAGDAGMGDFDEFGKAVSGGFGDDEPADAEAGHGPGFGEAADHQDAVVRGAGV